MTALTTKNENNIYYILRVAAAMCFIGHGAFGIIGKEIWCNYFAVFCISKLTAHQLMPFVGGIDLLMGFSILIYPLRVVIGWLVVWAAITAMLRPLSGEPFEEFIERAGNYGVPLVLLMICADDRSFFKAPFAAAVPAAGYWEQNKTKVYRYLKIITFLLLLGHGGLNVIEKKGIMQQYTALGFSDPHLVGRIVGLFEITAAFTILIRPVRSLVLVLLVWKMGTELFYPHWEMFEWIERGGSYGALLALWMVLPQGKALFQHKQTALQ